MRVLEFNSRRESFPPVIDGRAKKDMELDVTRENVP